MTTAFLYIFVFSTWGLGLLSWVIGLGQLLARWELEAKEKNLEIEQKKVFLSRINSIASGFGKGFPRGGIAGATESGSKELPEKLKELMKSSPNHPEVDEIDSTDEIIGVRFEAENYPPGFGDADEE
jgi:hypothetical protein